MTDCSLTIGVISDTHGLVRPEALAALEGVAAILHAGDIGDPEVLTQLGRIATVHAVRGNNDGASWADHIPLTDIVEVASHTLYLVHELEHMDLDPVAAGCSAVIYGHSHRPHAEHRKGVLYLNPGSAGPRRFSLPVAVARIHVEAEGLRHEIVELAV